MNRRHNRRGRVISSDINVEDCDNENCVSTQFLQIQESQINDLQGCLERYCNVLPAFGFNSTKYDINLFVPYSLPFPVNERGFEPTIITEAKQFISFKISVIQQLDRMCFLSRATSLDSLCKANRTSETKTFFPYDCFHHPDKIKNRERPPYDAFYSKLRNCNPLEAEYTDYVNPLNSRFTTEQCVTQLQKSKPQLNGTEKHQYL